MLFTMGITVTGCGSNVDYATPIEAAEAHKNGTNIVGKTINVTATMDYAPVPGFGGVIYSTPSMSLMANIFVCPTGDSGAGVVKGKTVKFKVSEVDDHLKNSIYLMGTVVK